MSLVTSCPACGTMFRVVPDQLRISEGWVRCGHCSEVFDATVHMAGPGTDLREGPQTQPGEMPTQPGWMEPPTTVAGGVAAREEFQPSQGFQSGAAAAGTAPREAEVLEESPLDGPFVFRRSDLEHLDSLPAVHPPAPDRVLDSRGPDSRGPDSVAAAAPTLDDVSFVQEARRQAFWRRPLVRFTLTFASLLLACALGVQFAYQDRDRLAAQQPQLRPALRVMCDVLQCTLGPPRQIESIVIENSSFNKLRSDAYRLSFTLRNTAAVEVATPAMELTLTDTQDQPVLRRVLLPDELGARGNVIEGASDWTGTVGLTVGSTGASRIAGYRLLAFYP